MKTDESIWRQNWVCTYVCFSSLCINRKQKCNYVALYWYTNIERPGKNSLRYMPL